MCITRITENLSKHYMHFNISHKFHTSPSQIPEKERKYKNNNTYEYRILMGYTLTFYCFLCHYIL